MWAPDDRFRQSDAAVIDVGSNSVRLVFYRLEGRAVWTVFNEKVLAGLGRDLGGGSLELIRLDGGKPTDGVPLPLGPFAMGEPSRLENGRVRAAVARTLRPLDDAFRANTLNAVGGAWRSLAIIHMRMTDYPLEIVHQYEL